eukprot:1099419-Rhodomonas_salina.2
MPSRTSASNAGNRQATQYFRATKLRHGAFAAPPKGHVPASKRAAVSDDESDAEMPAYEKQRLQNMANNAKVLDDLGLSKMIATVKKKTPPARRATPAKRNSKKQPSRWRDSDSESFEEEEDSAESDSDVEVVPPKKSKRTAFERPAQTAKQTSKKLSVAAPAVASAATRRSSAKPAVKYAGVNLKTRRIKVSIFTEDTNKDEWHFATITASRTKKGKLEHLVKWDTVGEDDEWLDLSEEKHYLFEEGEEEVTEDEDESEWKVKQNVEVFTEGENGEDELGVVRLLESFGGRIPLVLLSFCSAMCGAHMGSTSARRKVEGRMVCGS